MRKALAAQEAVNAHDDDETSRSGGKAAWIICAKYTEYRRTFKLPFIPVWAMFKF